MTKKFFKAKVSDMGERTVITVPKDERKIFKKGTMVIVKEE